VCEHIRRTMGDTIDLLRQQHDDIDYLTVFRHFIDIKHDGQLKTRASGVVNFDSRRVDESTRLGGLVVKGGARCSRMFNEA